MQAEFKWSTKSSISAPSTSLRLTGQRQTRSNDGRFAGAICENYDEPGEIEGMCDQIKSQLGGVSPDLVLLFASAPKYPKFEDAVPEVRRLLDAQVLVGCSGSGIIGGGRELESGPAMAVLAASSDTNALHPFAFSDKQAGGKGEDPDTLIEAIGADPSDFDDGLMLIFIDPLTVSTESALSILDSAYPSVMKFGALVSGGHEYGENRMLLGNELRHHGAVGLLMKNTFDAETIVSGSEEPIGPSMVITKSNRNEIHQLDNRNPMSVLEEIFLNADPLSQLRMKRSLVVGLESSGMLLDPDYVMRNIMEMDEETGAMMIGDLVEDGQALQFHVRDSELASRRLIENLDRYATQIREHDRNIDAMLCFNSVARGYRMFEEDHHDAKIIAEHFNDMPMAGFFSNGEIVSRRGGFALNQEEEYESRVMGYSDTLVMLRDGSRRHDLDFTKSSRTHSF